MNEALEAKVVGAREGDRRALTELVHAIAPDVYRLALRFFGSPSDAEDATQETLVQLVTKLSQFDGASAFSTWVYRVAANKFLSMARSENERAAVGFEELERTLGELPADAPQADDVLLLEEVKIGCTLAMLLCLDREQRLAFIAGAVMELDHRVAAEILGVSADVFRKRLERARARVTHLMRARCGLFEPHNACRCSRRVGAAVARGCVVPDKLVYATSAEQARRFPEVLREIRRLEEAQRAAALYRSHPDALPRGDLARFLAETFAQTP